MTTTAPASPPTLAAIRNALATAEAVASAAEGRAHEASRAYDDALAAMHEARSIAEHIAADLARLSPAEPQLDEPEPEGAS